MCFSVQQVLVGPNGAPGIPKATSDAVTSDLEPLPLHLVTELGHLRKDQARLETQFQKLQVQVGPPHCPTLALGHTAQNPAGTHLWLRRAPTPGPVGSPPSSAD